MKSEAKEMTSISTTLCTSR